MKKHIAIAIGLAVVSGSAFATKARLEALGEDKNGSQFLSDNRNVFLNAAHLNYHKDLVTYEWGETNQTGALGDTDATTQPHAEGGVFKSNGNMVYGIYLGGESDISNSWRAASGSAATKASLQTEHDVLDVFVGGDAGVQWGANITYSASKDEVGAEKEQSLLRARLGVISGDVEGFANIGISNKSEAKATGTETDDTEFNGKGSYDVGVSYNMNDVTAMVRYSTAQAEEKESETDFKYVRQQVGVAKTYKLNEKATMWVNAWYKMEEAENHSTADGVFSGTGEEKATRMPVGIAVEVMAREWLALRGSVSQNVLFSEKENDDGDKSPIKNTTSVKAGASLLFGDLSVDGMIGNTDDGGVTDSDTGSENGTLRTDSLMSRVSLTYRF